MTDPTHAWWEARARLHPTSPDYAAAIAALRDGRPVLLDPERDLVGDVTGRRLLHLQCHIGTDTLAWVREGAVVTGVDYAAAALDAARGLAASLGLDATFVQADVCDLPPLGTFDVVVTTYGVLGWLRDLDAWAAGIARSLAPEGRFVLVDTHPVAMAVDPRQPAPEALTLIHDVTGGAARRKPDGVVAYQHGFGDVVGALTRAGLVIDRLDELRWHCGKGLAALVQDGDRWVMPPPFQDRVPLLFALRARWG